MKTLMVVMLVAVLLALAGAGVYMLRKGEPGQARSRHMARALALRVGLSVALFLLILLSWAMGWMQPSGIPLAQ